jgi:hypothetical protein
VRRASGGDDDIGVAQRIRQIFKGERGGLPPIGEFLCPRVRAIDDGDAVCSRGRGASTARHFACANDHGMRCADSADCFFGQPHGDRADAGWIAADGGVGAGALARVNGIAEQRGEYGAD